jgi:hypothetical protein
MTASSATVEAPARQMMRCATGLLHDVEQSLAFLGEERKGLGHELGEYVRSLAAAEDEQPERTIRRGHFVRTHGGDDRLAHGIADVSRPRYVLRPFRMLETGREDSAEPQQQPVGAPDHGVLLVRKDRNLGEPRRSGRGNRRVAAEANDNRRPHSLQELA